MKKTETRKIPRSPEGEEKNNDKEDGTWENVNKEPSEDWDPGCVQEPWHVSVLRIIVQLLQRRIQF